MRPGYLDPPSELPVARTRFPVPFWGSLSWAGSLLIVGLGMGFIGLMLLGIAAILGMNILGMNVVQNSTALSDAAAPDGRPVRETSMVVILPNSEQMPKDLAPPVPRNTSPDGLAVAASASMLNHIMDAPVTLPVVDAVSTVEAEAGGPDRNPYHADPPSVQTALEEEVLLARLEHALIQARQKSLAEQIQPTTPTFRQLFQEVGSAYGIDWRLLAAIAYQESRLNPLAVGEDAEYGLMQILPTTWAEFAPAAVQEAPFDPYNNVEVSAHYLLYLQDYLNQLHHGELYWVLAAYNWGPDNIRGLVQTGGDWYDVPERPRHYAASIIEMAFGVHVPDQ